jgi:nucleolar protein 53
MPDNLGAPSQPSQPSRKGKKAWRKNVDITPITSGLESLREEIRLGGPVNEKPSSELFIVDTKGSDEIRRKTRGKILKVDEILGRRSAVPALEGRGVKRGISRVGYGIVEEGKGKRRKEWVSKAEVKRLRDNLDNKSYLGREQIEDGGAGFDLWEEQPKRMVTRMDEYVPKPQKKVAPKSIRQKPVAMTVSGRAVKAVANPDAGTSYNPSFEEWDDLLTREGAKEVEAEKVRLVREQERAEKEARIAAIAAADEREGQSDYESAWEGFSEDDEETLKKKRPERKTPAQRNKVKRRQKEEQRKRHEAASGAREMRNVDAVLAMVKSESEQALVPAEDDENAGDDAGTQLRRRKMGNTVIPEKPLELVLPDELQESLRRLKPEGNLMNDRFRNLLVNGKIESRKPIYQGKKKKVKMTEKWSYKDFEIPV